MQMERTSVLSLKKEIEMKEQKFNQVKYQNNYINEKYDRVNLTVPKGMKDEIKRRASEVGESMNEYINNAIKMRGEREITNEKL